MTFDAGRILRHPPNPPGLGAAVDEDVVAVSVRAVLAAPEDLERAGAVECVPHGGRVDGGLGKGL